MQKETTQGARPDSELILLNQLHKVKDGKLISFLSFLFHNSFLYSDGPP